MTSLEILPGRFVKYEDFNDYDIVSYLQNCGLYHMFSTDSRQGYYPFLIHLFYTNLTYEEMRMMFIYILWLKVSISSYPQNP